MSLGIVFIFALAMIIITCIIGLTSSRLNRLVVPVGVSLLLMGWFLLQVQRRASPPDIQMAQPSNLTVTQRSSDSSDKYVVSLPEQDDLEAELPEMPTAESKSDAPISVLEMTFNLPNGPLTRKHSETIPDWVSTKSEFAPRRYTHWVIVSQRYATANEARDELSRRIGIELEKNQLYVKSNADKTGNFAEVYARLIKENAIIRECKVAWPLEVGGFRERVYQIAWEIRINPEVISRLHADWNRQRSQANLIRLASAFGGITMLFATLTFVLRQRQKE
ncbi:hypothetical protein [Planctomicrobium sp. SH527]|uniref:hypothetical protein n=1 Tax=Planctomicrobium sp. SH527 TaxID=3448123 RepID=UPI003F5C8F29